MSSYAPTSPTVPGTVGHIVSLTAHSDQCDHEDERYDPQSQVEAPGPFASAYSPPNPRAHGEVWREGVPRLSSRHATSGTSPGLTIW